MIVKSYVLFISPLAMRDIFNGLMPPINPDVVLNMLPTACLTIAGATILGGALGHLHGFIVDYIAQRAKYNLRNSVFDALVKKSFSFYDHSHVGDIISRTTNDIERVQWVVSGWISQLASTTIQVTIAASILSTVNYQLTIITMLQIPFIFLVINSYQRLSRPIFLRELKAWSETNTFLHQNILGTRIVRLFNQADSEKKKFRQKNGIILDTGLKLAKLRGIPQLNEAIISITTALIYWYGGNLIISTSGTPMPFRWGDMVLYIQSMSMLMNPIISLVGTTGIEYTRSMIAAARIFEILDSETEVKEKPKAFELLSIRGEIKFENVSFEHVKGKPVLKNINLVVKPGENVAILGATGSGKSTLIQLIPRFYDATSGRVLVDGYDVKDVRLKSLRRQIGIALQDVFLFSRSIKENIAYGKPNATMEEIVKAAKMAEAHDFIMSFPDRYETIIGERGVTLSGGQRQRITIARALLMNPRILILDDSTSSVDTETEQQIQRALEALLENRTTFIIAQRLSTIKNADKIVVLKDGEIVEVGTHEELLAENGSYANIYMTQFGSQEFPTIGEERYE